MSRTRDVAQDSTGYRGYHRVSSVVGGRTAEIAIFGKNIAIFGKNIAIFCLFWRFAQIFFGFHRVSRISQGFTGFHRVSSAESASRHSSAGYVFEASPRWRAESVGWNTYSLPHATAHGCAPSAGWMYEVARRVLYALGSRRLGGGRGSSMSPGSRRTRWRFSHTSIRT